MDVSGGDLPSQGVLKGCPMPGKPCPFCSGTLEPWGGVGLPTLLLDSAQLCSGPAPHAPPRPALPPGARTLVLILNGKAKDVARAEASAVVHATVEKRMCIRIRNVQDLARGRHVARDALVGWDADLIALPGQAWVGRKKLVAGHRADHRLSCLLPGSP